MGRIQPAALANGQLLLMPISLALEKELARVPSSHFGVPTLGKALRMP